MAFRVNRKSRWGLGFLLAAAGTACLGGGVAQALSQATVADNRNAVVTLVTSAIAAALCFGIAAWAVAGWLFPMALTADGDAIRLLARDRVIGEIPFANLDRITIMWEVTDPLRSDPLTAAATYVAGPNKTPSGIVFVLRDRNDPKTSWPRAGFTRAKDYIVLDLSWELPYQTVADELRAYEVAYLEAHGLLPPVEEEVNPFDFTS
jgi:hypothetical protein